MATSAYLEEFRALTLAATQGLEQALRTDPTHELTSRLALERFGDLVRSEALVPEKLGAWAFSLSEDLISECVRGAGAEAKTWPLPESRLSWPESEESDGEGSLAFVLQRRDQIESMREGIVKVLLGRGRSPASVNEWSILSETLRQVDARLVETVPRQFAEHLLGIRMCLGRAGDWVSRLVDEAQNASLASESSSELDGMQLPTDYGEPSDEVVNDYISTGAMYRYVEGYALKNPEFAEDLASIIDTLKEEGELGTAFSPRKWRKNYAGGEKVAVVYELAPARLAAADEQISESSQALKLGSLPGLAADVDARLSLSAGMWRLTLEVGSGKLTKVQLNEHSQSQPEADGSWRLEAPLSGHELRLRVEDSSGALFDERIQVHSRTP
jgi:hypothetical protein